MNEHTTTCGISHPFGQLFPTSGQVTYALLSRPPLTIRANPDRPFDLHVSCTPPAFILSQDQTLQRFARPCGRDSSRRVCPLAHPSGFPATLQLLRCSTPEGVDRHRRRALMMGLGAVSVKPTGAPGIGLSEPGRRPEPGQRGRMIAAFAAERQTGRSSGSGAQKVPLRRWPLSRPPAPPARVRSGSSRTGARQPRRTAR